MVSKPKSSDVAVNISGVTQRYGKALALDDVNLEVTSGSFYGYIGPDGVGKSTLLSLIAGVREIHSGTVEVLGGNMANANYRHSVLPRIAYMPQGLGHNLYPTLSVYANIDFFARLFGLSREERESRIDDLLTSTGLKTFANRAAGKLSGGMKQKLGLCCALIHDPDLLILDEPTTGIDPLSRRQFWDLIERIRSRRIDMSVLVATAYMEEAENFDILVAMDGGKILATGSPDELKSRSGAISLEEAFVNLLPEEKRRGHRKLAIPPRKSKDKLVAIEAIDLTRRFNNFTAVDHVSFRIERGEIFGFVGSNGCGKTTTMKMLTGLLKISEGEAKLFGRSIDAKDIKTRRRVGYMSQSFSLYTELTVGQNLYLHARLFHLPIDQIPGRVKELADQMDLANVMDNQAGKLPVGIRQRLSLAVAIIHKPEILILDEPTSGVDPVARDKFWELLVDISRNLGVTIFISTHFMNEAERCDRISLMHAGRVLATDIPDDLVRSMNVTNLEEAFIAYLEKEGSIGRDTSEPEDISDPRILNSDPNWKRTSSTGFFNLNRLWAFARRESIELIRDPIRLSFALLGPLILMVVLAYGISFDVENLPYAVLDRDQTPDSRKYLENYSGSRYFEEHNAIKDYTELENRLKSGELKVAIEIPPEFGRDLKRGRRPEIGIWIDGALPFRAETARGYVLGLHELYLSDRELNWDEKSSRTVPYEVENRFRYNQDMKSIYAIVPGVIAMLLALIPSILSAVGVVREKELGSITNLYSTPSTRLEFLIGKQIPYMIVGMINFLSLVLLAILLFGVPIKGSFVSLCAGTVLYVISITGFGSLVSTFTKTQIGALFAALLITIITSMEFSGFLEPISSLTGGAELVGKTFPTAYYLKISVGSFTKSLNFDALALNYLALGIFIIAYLLLCLLFLRKQEA
jgi:ribosome-dependent ATPase